MTVNFELLKVSKMTSLKTLYILSHGEAKSIKFGHQVNPHSKATIDLSG